ncbi:MAG: hypothetical protein ACP5ID_03465 [Conexivisphaera sp.]
MAKIIVNMDIEVDDSLAEKVVDLLSKTTDKATERELPAGLELEVSDVGGKLILRIVEGGEREGGVKG